AHELRENTVTQLVVPLDVLGGFQVNTLGINLATESDDFRPVLIHFKPAMNHRLIDFQMKLKTMNVRAIPKSLFGAYTRARKMDGLLWDVARLHVPVENFLCFFELSKQWIFFRITRRGNVIPTDFLFFVRVNSGAQCFRDQLSAKANSKDGKIFAHCGLD